MSRLFHCLCIGLLLIAQQAAIVHATWHAGGGLRVTDAYGPDRSPEVPADRSSQGSLCAFDLAFGQMLGGVHGSCAAPVVADLPTAIASDRLNPRLGSESVPALARGPPVLL